MEHGEQEQCEQISRDELVELLTRVLKGLRPPWEEVETATDRGSKSFQDWAAGRRQPTGGTMRDVARFLRDHAAKLVSLADELERVSHPVERSKTRQLQKLRRKKPAAEP